MRRSASLRGRPTATACTRTAAATASPRSSSTTELCTASKRPALNRPQARRSERGASPFLLNGARPRPASRARPHDTKVRIVSTLVDAPELAVVLGGGLDADGAPLPSTRARAHRAAQL